MTEASVHWDRVYEARSPDEVSWYEPSPEVSLAMIAELDLDRDDPIVDAGGGASGLARELLRLGFRDVTVADVSAAALERARAGLGAEAERVQWRVADLRAGDLGRRFALWHDRAAFHFMVGPADRSAYAETLARSLAPGGHALIATFGPDGPTRCSGLPTARYDGVALEAAFGGRLTLVATRIVEHTTPAGKGQQFLYALLERSAEGQAGGAPGLDAADHVGRVEAEAAQGRRGEA